MLLIDQVKSVVRDVEGYPRPGIVFKDITPVLADPLLTGRIIDFFVAAYQDKKIDMVAAIEARGFILGSMLAHRLGCGFVPIRKAGRLPFKTKKQRYDLEYGSAEIEVHEDAIKPGARVLVHDDLLATGGTARAGAKLIKSFGAELVTFSFLINLSFLPGAEKLTEEFGVAPDFLVKY
jgi:adenine phosphoribosyltransferase